MSTFFFTSESVGQGHPDKLCDQDENAKVACETAIKTGLGVVVFGEVSTKAKVDYEQVVRRTIKEVGYDNPKNGFDANTCTVTLALEQQSQDIAAGLDHGSLEALGAGDQGIMFGYASDETPSRMPLTCTLSHALNMALKEARTSHMTWLGPDSKTQVTVEYRHDHGAVVPLRVDTVVVSTQHAENVSTEFVRQQVLTHIVQKVIPQDLTDSNTKIFIQPAGRFVIGGPEGDAGLTGRKIIVDVSKKKKQADETYGGWGAHGGGAFSGKDFSKVDRSAAYAARWIARSLVDANLVRRVLVQLSYAIGVAEPLSIFIDSYGTSKSHTNSELVDIVRKNFDLRPGAIAQALDLRKPIYQQTAVYGHFGHDKYTWEQSKVLDL